MSCTMRDFYNCLTSWSICLHYEEREREERVRPTGDLNVKHGLGHRRRCGPTYLPFALDYIINPCTTCAIHPIHCFLKILYIKRARGYLKIKRNGNTRRRGVAVCPRSLLAGIFPPFKAYCDSKSSRCHSKPLSSVNFHTTAYILQQTFSNAKPRLEMLSLL